MKHSLTRRAVVAAAPLITLPLLVLTAAPGAALASPAATANGNTIYNNNFYCGGAVFTNPADAVGSAQFHVAQNGLSMQVIVHLNGAIPNSTYHYDIWSGNCTGAKLGDSFTTNSNGVANDTLTVPIGSAAIQQPPLNPANGVWIVLYGPNDVTFGETVSVVP